VEASDCGEDGRTYSVSTYEAMVNIDTDAVLLAVVTDAVVFDLASI